METALAEALAQQAHAQTELGWLRENRMAAEGCALELAAALP